MTTRVRGSAAMRKPKDPEKTRADILRAATDEFATRGLEGARIDAIARKTHTTRAMIYYYFESKEGLYLAVLEAAYRGIRDAEKSLDLSHLAPDDGLRALVAFTFDYYQAHPEFVALVVAENQAGGRHLTTMKSIRRLNVSIIDTIDDVLERGRRAGRFRDGFDAVDLHMTIASLGWFQVANRHTFGHLFGRDFTDAETAARHRALATEVVMQFALRPGALRRRVARNGDADTIAPAA